MEGRTDRGEGVGRDKLQRGRREGRREGVWKRREEERQGRRKGRRHGGQECRRDR
jgi:hypothetical protein